MLHALAAERSGREIWWLHGARNGTEHPFAAEVRSLLSELPNARSHICYSQPGAADHAGDDYDTPGRLSGELIAWFGVPRNAEAYLCGPESFMADLGASLTGLGFQPSCIHYETFGSAGARAPGVVAGGGPAASPHPPARPPGRGSAVSFARNDLAVRWDDAHGSLLELAEACDVPVRWSCRTGVCHTCETALLSGSVRYSPDPVDPPAAGNVLICCSQPETRLVLDL
jgi:ferredoxin-NADP reductase